MAPSERGLAAKQTGGVSYLKNHTPSDLASLRPPPAGGPVGGSDSPPDCHSLPPTALRLPSKREARPPTIILQITLLVFVNTRDLYALNQCVFMKVTTINTYEVYASKGVFLPMVFLLYI